MREYSDRSERFCGVVYWRRLLALSLVLCSFGLSVCWSAYCATIATFDVPGAGTGKSEGTYAGSINPEGTIAGDYIDANGISHGFVRAANGAFTTFHIPSVAGTHWPALATIAASINPAGTVTGGYNENTSAGAVELGYVRAADGEYTTFGTPNGPGAGVGLSINSLGWVTGYYFDIYSVAHGYLRAADGTLTTFDAPGGGTLSDVGTFPGGINPAGVIAGYYSDAGGALHGFLRDNKGNFTTFDAPSAIATIAVSINPADAITGYYSDASGSVHGFLRANNGNFTTFDASEGAVDTVANSINSASVITGYYYDADSVRHGYVRAPNGIITTFDVPGAVTENGLGINALSINSAGTITGYYYDAGFVAHGFVRSP
jgi:hypothetical protein